MEDDAGAILCIPELDREGAVCGPYELVGTITPLAVSEERVFEIAWCCYMRTYIVTAFYWFKRGVGT